MPQASPPTGGGWRIFVDPVTGRILDVPLPAQERALETIEQAGAAQRRVPRIENFTLPDGTRGVFLDGAFTTSLHVHRRAEGGFDFGCQEQHPNPSDGSHGSADERNAPKESAPTTKRPLQ